MPLAQSGLLAVAVNFTGEPYCPLVGDVTVTTGVVAKSGIVSTTKPQRAIRKRIAEGSAEGRARGRDFTEYLYEDEPE
jgi:hypothetical protein